VFIAASVTLILLILLGVRGRRHFFVDGKDGAQVLLRGLFSLFLPFALGFLGLMADADAQVPLWSLIGIAAGVLTSGFVMGRRGLSLDASGYVFGALYGLTLLVFFVTNTSLDIASSWFQSVLILPPFVWALGYLAHSMGDLFGKDRSSGIERWLARRWLMTRRGTTLSVVTAISVAGVALGTWLVIVALAILSGFEEDLTQKIIGAHAHVEASTEADELQVLNAEQEAFLNSHQEIEAWSRTIEREVAVASQSNYARARIQGIDWPRGKETFRIISEVDWKKDELEAPESNVGDDPFAFAAPERLPGIVIGVEMARNLNLRVGDTLRLVSPILTTITPVGSAPKSQGFEVVALFHSKMYEYDAHFAFVDIEDARLFFEVDAGGFDKIQIRAAELDVVLPLVSELKSVLPPSDWRLLDWRTRNQTLFAALQLERVTALVVLTFIIMVASFSVVTTLAMSVIEKTPEIAVLRTIGSTAHSVVRVFLWQGLIVGGAGVAFGVGFAALTIYALKHIGLWIPNDVYYIDSLPVAFEWSNFALIVFGAFVVLWNFSMIPARRAATLLPVEGLREG